MAHGDFTRSNKIEVLGWSTALPILLMVLVLPEEEFIDLRPRWRLDGIILQRPLSKTVFNSSPTSCTSNTSWIQRLWTSTRK